MYVLQVLAYLKPPFFIATVCITATDIFDKGNGTWGLEGGRLKAWWGRRGGGQRQGKSKTPVSCRWHGFTGSVCISPSEAFNSCLLFFSQASDVQLPGRLQPLASPVSSYAQLRLAGGQRATSHDPQWHQKPRNPRGLRHADSGSLSVPSDTHTAGDCSTLPKLLLLASSIATNYHQRRQPINNK